VPKENPDRRSVLAAAGTAALLALAGPAQAEDQEIRGTVAFVGDTLIPKGQIRIRLEGLGDDTPRPEAELASDGRATEVDFRILLPAAQGAGTGARIVGRLERKDGWLLARGSVQVRTDLPIALVLHTVMY
jgi:hypothetical protein